MYKYSYKTPDGFSDMMMKSDGEFLTGLWFVWSKDARKHETRCAEKELEVFKQACKWLDIYFNGKMPDFLPKYKIENATPFRREVIDIMSKIKYGEVLTYGDIAKQIAGHRKVRRMSAQAVGGAVGWNQICIIIPCHRVVGANNNLTGYGGGIENKLKLLELEGVNVAKYAVSV